MSSIDVTLTEVAASLVLVSAIQGVNTRVPTLVLGAFSSPGDVGVYVAGGHAHLAQIGDKVRAQ